ALRMVYIANDAFFYSLTLDMANPVAGTIVPYPTAGSGPIRIDCMECYLGTRPLQLNVGDFAVVGDTNKADLIRITSITDNEDGTYGIGHDPSVSAWNRPLIDNFGYGVTGGAFMYNVNVVTYALDTANNTLMLDHHFGDDGFDGEVFEGPMGLALN